MLESMARDVLVDLGERSYTIDIGLSLLANAGSTCSGLGLSGKCLIVSDSDVGERYGENLHTALSAAGIDARFVAVPSGENSKSHEQLLGLYHAALEHGLDRSSFVVALGGGVVGDLAGYLAATYLRGIRYIQIPTTIVSMVDSAVGGKTGINMPEGKNLIGAFWQPHAVIADLETLATLPDREYRSGLAEVVKYGVIADAELFDRLEIQAADVLARDPGLLEELVARSCEIKADVVRDDEREGGLRAILNYGHTVGHAIEKVASYGTFLHGEAIAVGMVFAAEVSARRVGLPAESVKRIRSLLAAFGLPGTATGCAWSAVRETIRVDKKSVASNPRFVLAESIGRAQFGCEVEEKLLEEIWNGLGK